jgi:hypothetical protein
MTSPRVRREKKTVAVMVGMYCRAHHSPGGEVGLCPHCRGLLTYAEDRIDRCVFRDSKPTCNRCPVHCYARGMREQVKSVMRYAGPRMMGAHPVLAVMHLADGLRHRGGERREDRAASR